MVGPVLNLKGDDPAAKRAAVAGCAPCVQALF